MFHREAAQKYLPRPAIVGRGDTGGTTWRTKKSKVFWNDPECGPWSAVIGSGDDASHATSAAHTLRELMPQAKLSALMPPQQNAQTVGQWIRESAA